MIDNLYFKEKNMKKKVLLISLMIAVFLIAFSVSAFAVDVVEKTEDETY